MKKFWRVVREEVVFWPLWILWLGFFIGAFFAPSTDVPTWSCMNVLVTGTLAYIYIGVLYIVKSFCRWSLKREDKR